MFILLLIVSVHSAQLNCVHSELVKREWILACRLIRLGLHWIDYHFTNKQSEEKSEEKRKEQQTKRHSIYLESGELMREHRSVWLIRNRDAGLDDSLTALSSLREESKPF